MNKMGFISGKGLGSKHTGRIDPINPIKDIGGRMYNRRYGLGYTKPVPVSVEPVPAELVPAEPVPAGGLQPGGRQLRLKYRELL